MKEPTSFTFHRSYAELIWRIKDPVKEGRFIETLTRYAFQHVTPSEDDPNFNYFILIRPIIDKGMERAESGSRGGKAAKHRKGSLEATFGTNESEKDKEKDKEQEEDKDKDVESMFAEFWSAYPRKDAKKSARKVFLRILSDTDDPRALLAKILDAIALAKQSHQWQKDNGDFIPLPATWLNQERWEDSGVSETLEEPTDEDRNQKLTNFADTLLDERS